jgi:hypothetical protein
MTPMSHIYEEGEHPPFRILKSNLKKAKQYLQEKIK